MKTQSFPISTFKILSLNCNASSQTLFLITPAPLSKLIFSLYLYKCTIVSTKMSVSPEGKQMLIVGSVNDEANAKHGLLF